MRIGIDFDNTIACYDGLFHRVAREAGLIPADLPVNKSDVRNHLRAIGREPAWTEMQGTVYGARMPEAAPYPGVLDFFRSCRAAGIPVFIISHKTRLPFAGPAYDLHAAARSWLSQMGFFEPGGIGLSEDHVFFELTKAEKLGRIAACECTHFIDDLPEILLEPSFPTGVYRLLFDPHRLHPEGPPLVRLTSWEDASGLLGIGGPEVARRLTGNTATAVVPGAQLGFAGVPEILRDAGLPSTPPPVVTPLPGGANNQVFRVTTGGTSVVLKRYFHNPADPRDRFGVERAFYTWAGAQAPRSLPRPLAWSAEHRLGLFEFIEGRRLASSELGPHRIDEAIELISGINRRRELPEAQSLPCGSEACFSIGAHLERIDQRMDRLRTIPEDDKLDREAARFLAGELAPQWASLRERIARTAGGEIASELPPSRRCLSPSDFGFHNALVAPDDRLRFFDFEYAGWDDPAKLTGDFFSQPRIPVGLEHWDRVVTRLDEALGWSGELGARARLLLPAYRLKWCCIVLNEFLPSDRSRRTFANLGAEAVDAAKEAQLAKARQALASLGDCTA